MRPHAWFLMALGARTACSRFSTHRPSDLHVGPSRLQRPPLPLRSSAPGGALRYVHLVSSLSADFPSATEIANWKNAVPAGSPSAERTQTPGGVVTPELADPGP